jgi:hypothetical protein
MSDTGGAASWFRSSVEWLRVGSRAVDRDVLADRAMGTTPYLVWTLFGTAMQKQ